jgi:hypothetical protein
MKSTFLDRVSGRYFPDTTRREIIKNWSLYRRPPVLVPASKWTRDEFEDSIRELEIVSAPCRVCGRYVTCVAQDSINAYCGCKGKVTK